MPKRDYQQVFEQFNQLRVMVVGDVMVDTYLFGRVDRISPEAPVPVVTIEKRLNRLGGAANVALNLKAMGADPILCSVIGDDAKGHEFRQLLDSADISRDALVTSDDRITTTKFRVIGNKAQMLRVDEEVTFDLNEKDESALLYKIINIIESSSPDAIIFQDYNKGVLTTSLISRVIELAKSHHIPVAVDPKKKNFLNYKGVTLFKPNLKELREGLGMHIQSNEPGSLNEAAHQLHQNQDIAIVLVTLSDDGVFISCREQDGQVSQHKIPAHRRNISDVSGAGDTVISVASLCLACKLDPAEIASISNLAGGLVCEELGVVPVNRDKLLKETLNLFS
ncbi:MAG: D-glycero-beta-D-manno-heptose-7-phosphate kinase [Bacteroidales bacterium]|nr:D-glycero-beta-D-manno-heptose-7-phosphate kinase [Bacteroidales bacterium]